MDQIIVYASVLAALTIPFVQFVKEKTTLPKYLMPYVALTSGVVVGVIALFVPEITGDLSIGGHILAGCISGLAAAGLYDLGKNTYQGIKKASAPK